jgi:dihydroorotase
VEFDYAASGMIGLETSLALSLSLVAEGVVTLNQLVAKMSTNPARILKIPKGTLKVGADADVTVIDPDEEWTVDVNRFQSRSKNTPFNGWRLRGRALVTIVAGDIKYRAR